MPYGMPNISFIGHPMPMPCPGHAGLGFRLGRSADADLVLDHLRRLSQLDQRLRFRGALSDAGLCRHATGLWDRVDLVLIAQDGLLWASPPLRPGPVRAVAEVAIDGDTAEIAVSVDESLRRRGLGAWLTRTAGFLLAPRGVTRLKAYTLADNTSMVALGRASGAEIRTEGDEIEIDFDVATLRRAYLQRRTQGLFREAS
ncbi:N-acetyltransferase family protein [Amaricoccus sp. W119]|uniref:GNAT family N-acetyltransferase n=1 Tax=Amaricoccus sp. W119 TaxID=3391833 RepID=UPI0039A4D4FF